MTQCCLVTQAVGNSLPAWQYLPGSETVPGTGEVAKFPAETLGTHKDGNTAHLM
jgi:hypothetical protein